MFCIGQLDAASVGLDDVRHDRETKTGSGTGVELDAAHEGGGPVGIGDPRPIIDNDDSRVRGGPRAGDADGRDREARRVFKQVSKDLGEVPGIDLEEDVVFDLDREMKRCGARHTADDFDDVAGDGCN